MMTSNRQTNKIFTILLFIISFVFAYFLLQAGSLVIKQIPSVGLNLTVKDLVDKKEIKKINNSIDDLKSKIELLHYKNNAIKTKHRGQKKNLNFEKQNYKELLDSRYVTEDVKSNTKIENLRKKIETKRKELQSTSSKITLLDNKIAVLKHKKDLFNKEKRDLNHEARKVLKDKRKWNTFKSFWVLTS
jgi:cell division protein FtsB